MLKNIFSVITVLLLWTTILLVSEVHGHGMMLDPVSRSSRWRYNKSAPINYDDNGLFCGGFGVQWFKNNGKCGLCGDDFAVPKPRPNELGGMYGQGIITKAYFKSQTALLGIKITTNHLGFFYFNICNLDKFKVESEVCFNANKIKFSDGSLKMYIGTKAGMIYPTIVFPKDLKCKHCVLRWNYQAGNNWGPCGNGTSALGCGPQENFKGCSDISITGKLPSPKIKHDLKRKWSEKFLNRINNLDYEEFVAREEPPPNLLLDNYLYKFSESNDDFNNILLELQKDENTVPVFDNYVQNGIDNIMYDSDYSIDPVKDQINKEQDEIFDKGFDNADHIFGDSKAMQESVGKIVNIDHSTKQIGSDMNINAVYEFDNEI